MDALLSSGLTDTGAAALDTAQAMRTAAFVRTGASADEIRAAGEKFEAMFLGQMFQYMFEGVNTDPIFGGGNAETMYRSLMVDEYGKLVAHRGGLGIADAVTRSLLQAQETRS